MQKFLLGEYRNKLTMPMEDGYYIYVLKATWNKGKETFVFDVNVK
ncbi:hypothetical protein [Lysinibacillus xylanilyticus]|nr:hypothetical protein [Lysinibacillus xylanilyticus]